MIVRSDREPTTKGEEDFKLGPPSPLRRPANVRGPPYVVRIKNKTFF